MSICGLTICSVHVLSRLHVDDVYTRSLFVVCLRDDAVSSQEQRLIAADLFTQRSLTECDWDLTL